MFNVMPNLFYRIASLCFGLYLALSGATLESLDYSDMRGDPDYPSLFEVYEDYFPIGAAVYGQQLDNPRLREFILKNFNSITPEWQLKQNSYEREHDTWGPETIIPAWQLLQPGDEDYRLKYMDILADFAREHNLQLRGHTLIWPVSNVWMLWTDETRMELTDKETLFARMDAYIAFIMNRYGDVINIWDVVNEPFHYGWTHRIKRTWYYEIAGEEFITHAFYLADKHGDENDVLMVNETFVEGNRAKISNMFRSVRKWQRQGVRIDGIGTQGHMGTISTVPFDVNFRIVDELAWRCRQLGLMLEYTEITMKLYETLEQREAEPSEWLVVWQRNKYQKLFEALRRNSDVIIGATFWGLDDYHCVVNWDKTQEVLDQPLLFDFEGNPK